MKILTRLRRKCLVPLGSLMVMGLPAFSAPITGSLGFSGTSLFTFTLSPGDSRIDFAPSLTGFGDIDADNRIGFFTVIAPNEAGLIRDMSTTNTPPFAWVPVATPVSIDNFLSFPSIPTTNIRMTLLPLADCSGGGTCVGPFQLLQTNVTDVQVSIGLVGQLINGPDSTPYTGSLTAVFLNNTVANVIAQANSPSGITANAFSGSIIAQNPIPEPATLTMFGIAAAAIAISRLRTKGGPRA